MKKMFLFVAAFVALMVFNAQAAVVQGKVQDVQGATIVLETADGAVQSYQVSDNTIYRAKKIMKEDTQKYNRQFKKGEAYFQPMVEEDDWVELTYTPNNQDLGVAEVNQVIVYDN